MSEKKQEGAQGGSSKPLRKKRGRVQRAFAIVTAAAAAVILAALLVVTPIGRYALSFMVMGPSSWSMEKNSAAARAGISVEIPVARAGEGEGCVPEPGWYPMMLTYDSGKEYGWYVGEPHTELLIHYTFADFHPGRGCSYLFDRSSPYYSSFYGAYIVTEDSSKSSEKGYCFKDDGSTDYDKLGEMARYDYCGLVIGDMMQGVQDGGRNGEGGLPELKFQWSVREEQRGAELCGYDDWTRVDGDIVTNGAAHTMGKLRLSYIQYGIPRSFSREGPVKAEDFGETRLGCRLYARYFKEKKATIIFYIMTGSPEVLEATDRACIRKSEIKIT